MENTQKIFAARVLFAVGLIPFICSLFMFSYVLANLEQVTKLAKAFGDHWEYWLFGSLGVLLLFGLAFMGLPLLSFLGIKKVEVSRSGFGVDFSMPESIEFTPRKNISEEIIQEKFEYAKTYVEKNNTQLPGEFAQDFQVLEEKLALTVTPCADPLTPMYMLDRNFRVIDWNLAFNLCFDRTLENMHGKSILEWTYFLDNYEEVLAHGIEVFAEGKALPHIDIEDIQYTSERYGKIKATKRAYQVPDDDGSCLGWLITINPTFVETEKGCRYQNDVFSALRKTLTWSEYALCYDKVLNNTQIYPELIQTLVGNRKPGPIPIRDSSVILDIGAGTGNVTSLLAQQSPNRLIVAIDNNPLMLNTLRRKCQDYLRHDAQGYGVIAMKQDVVSLLGLNDEFFDYVIINNVLYSLDIDAALNCLREAWRVLKPGGEIRISEPQKSTDLNKVLEQIRIDLKKNGKYNELETDYLRLCQINEFSLQPLLHRWTKDEMEQILLQNFSSITYKTDQIYAGQSILICAQK